MYEYNVKKYTPTKTIEKIYLTQRHPDCEYLVIAEFLGKNAITNATKVCDLLNEVSRSQGKRK